MDTRDYGFFPVARIPAGLCTTYITFAEDSYMGWVTIPGMASGAALKKNKSWPLCATIKYTQMVGWSEEWTTEATGAGV